MSTNEATITITQSEYRILLEAKRQLDEARDYRKEYNKREDVKAKRSAYMKKRNEKIKVALTKLDEEELDGGAEGGD